MGVPRREWQARRGDSAVRSLTQPIHLQNVMRRAHQRPFSLDLRQPTQEELPEATRLLDLPKDWFDDRFARGIDCRARLRVQLARHPMVRVSVGGQGPRGQGPGRSPWDCFRVEMYASMDVSAIATKFASEQ